MNDQALQLGYMLTGAALMLTLLGFGSAVIMPGIDRWSKRFFITFFTILLLYVIMGLLDATILWRPELKAAQEVVYFFETVFVTLLTPLITVYQLHCCGENWQSSVLFRAVAALWTVLFLALCFSPFTNLFYYIAPEDSALVRGPLYSLFVGLLDAALVLNLIHLVHRRDRLPRRFFHAFLTGHLPMILALTLHMFVSVFMIFGISIAICGLSIYSISLFDQADRYIRQQREIAHQKASITVLQMRPHFIYNTMMSIYYLCKQNPDLAQQVTLDFTTYLRRNFTAIASESPIPFSDELEHTRAYLAVEQAQFEDSLFVDFDTPHTDFRLPPLTLQPIVENAVKHGMDPDSDPLHILVRTRKTASGSEILVENSGAEFSPSADNEPHIALKNIRQRLEMMCRGQLTLEPRQGGGTRVRVTVSDPPQNRNDA